MQAEPSAYTLLTQAAEAQRNGRHEVATSLYRQVLSLDPANFIALANLGVAAAQNGDLDRGRELLEAAVRVQASSVEAWLALGNACSRAGAHARAAEAFGRVVHLRPELAIGHLNLGNALRRKGEAQAALDALRRGIALDPSLAAGHFNLGLALDDQGDHAAAIDAFQLALRRDPGNAATRTAMGNALLRSGKPEEALACFEQVARESPAFQGARYNRGVALQALGRDSEAVEDFGTAVAQEPNRLEARNNLIVSLIREGRADAALESCVAYEQLAPAHPRALAYRAAALLELGRPEAAAELLDFKNLVLSRMVAVPTGFDSLQAFNNALAHQVATHASLAYAPSGKSTRGGSQTGEFAHGNGGAAAALRGVMVEEIRRYMTHVRETLPQHPFVLALPDRWRLATWAVSLQSQGYQGPHFHPDGRISGVYYVALPESVVTSQDDSGALEFGRTNEAIGGNAPPLLHVVKPQEGLMVLFPSYFYHRTLLFESRQPRISIAFDLLPGD